MPQLLQTRRYILLISKRHSIINTLILEELRHCVTMWFKVLVLVTAFTTAAMCYNLPVEYDSTDTLDGKSCMHVCYCTINSGTSIIL